VKKPKTLETKLRSAIRLIWSRSAERNAVKRAAIYKLHIDSSHADEKVFDCPICHRVMADWAGEVDHINAVGTLESWRDVVGFIDRMFYSPQRFICKDCHRKKTKEDRRAMRTK
jgi:hypothetical protein